MNLLPRDLLVQPVTKSDLQAFGIADEQAVSLSDSIRECLNADSREARWMGLAKEVLSPKLPFELHQWLFAGVHHGHEHANGPPAAWIPCDETIACSNVTRLASSLGLADYDALFHWAKSHRPEFWQAVIDTLEIQFATPPAEMLAGDQWLPDAKLNIVDSCFQAPPEKVAIVSRNEQGENRSVTYRELQALTNRVSNGLREAGFVAGDRIAMMLPMSVEAIAAFLGTIQAGCVTVSIAESFAAPEIAIRMQLGDVKAIFVVDEIWRREKRLPCYAKLSNVDSAALAIVVPAGGANVDLGSNAKTWDEFLSSSTTFQSVSAEANSETSILFSSGTTGEPKAIPWTQSTPLKCAADARFHQNVREESVVAWPTSLGWMMGPWLVYAGLLNRATIAVYDGAPNSTAFCRFVQDARVTMLGVIPSLVRLWRNRGMIDGLDWSAIDAFSSTGECSNADDMLYLMSRAGYQPVIEYCGGTEIGGGYISSTVVQPNVPACFSTAAVGLDLTLIADGQCCDQGEVFLVGPSIGLSQRLLNADHDAIYFAETPRLADPDDKGIGRLRRHGDELIRFPSGYYQALGRSDDSMNLGGIKVSAVELERCLNSLDCVQESAAIAVPNKSGGPASLIIFVLPTTGDVDAAALKIDMQALLSSKVNPLFRISQVELVASLPRTASNKIMRRKLRDQIPAES